MKNKLKVYRERHDLTQELIIDKLRVTRQTILAIEKGKYALSLELAFNVSELLNEKIEDIFLYQENKKFTDIISYFNRQKRVNISSHAFFYSSKLLLRCKSCPISWK